MTCSTGLLASSLTYRAVVIRETMTALFAMIYRYLPDVKIAWRDVWFGAVVTALLFTVGKTLIGLYLGMANPMNLRTDPTDDIPEGGWELISLTKSCHS